MAANIVNTGVVEPRTCIELATMLANKFMSVKIKRTDLDAAERRLRGELIEKWEEKVKQTRTVKAV